MEGLFSIGIAGDRRRSAHLMRRGGSADASAFIVPNPRRLLLKPSHQRFARYTAHDEGDLWELRFAGGSLRGEDKISLDEGGNGSKKLV
jgi:hypothetical protein